MELVRCPEPWGSCVLLVLLFDSFKGVCTWWSSNSEIVFPSRATDSLMVYSTGSARWVSHFGHREALVSEKSGERLR